MAALRDAVAKRKASWQYDKRGQKVKFRFVKKTRGQPSIMIKPLIFPMPVKKVYNEI